MTPYTFVIGLALVGVLLWLNNVDVPLGTRVRQTINIAVVGLFILWVIFNLYDFELPQLPPGV